MASRKIPVTIEYRKPGTRPPLYVAGNYSEPPWQIQEMQYTTDPDGEHLFRHGLLAESGSKIQYKFRVGPGDWWILDEEAPTVTDAAGNRNNELEVMEAKPATTEEIVHENETDSRLRPSSNTTTEWPGRSVESGPGTPSFADTADEVADSAALLDQEASEAEVLDQEAARTGLRRTSNITISEVAQTADEVADSAELLDKETVKSETRLDIARESSFRQESLDEVDRMPLFAHECVGMYKPEDDGPTVSDLGASKTQGHAEGEDEFDPNDPTLERFPSDRGEIINRVRKLETVLNEDRTAFEGTPLSSVVGRRREGSGEVEHDLSLSPPIVAGVPHVVKRLEVPSLSPRGSISSANSSALSLHSIDEDEEAMASDREAHADGKTNMLDDAKSWTRKHAGDEDEGVVIDEAQTPIRDDGLEAHRAVASESLAPTTISPRTNHPEAASALQRPKTPADKMFGHHSNGSPRIVIEQAEEAGVGPNSQALKSSSSEATGNMDIARTTGKEASDTRQLKKRAAAVTERPGTPSSIHSIGTPCSEKENWLGAFFRLLFKDWIGGFLTKLCGGGRNK